MAAIMEKQPARVELDKADHLEWVDDEKYYNFSLQLGSKRRWRDKAGGSWKRDPSADGDGRTAYKHVSSFHAKIGPVPGDVLNGLIGLHNKFVKANRERQLPDGDVGRMVIVSGIKETKEIPATAAKGSDLATIIKAAVSEAVTETAKVLLPLINKK